MKINMFQNKYQTSNLLKIFFVEVVCFLVVAILSIGVCYSYFSDKEDATGNASMAIMTIDYRTDATNENTSVNVVYGYLSSSTNKTATEITSSTIITPGDVLTVKGYAVNTSEVGVYVLAKLEVSFNDGTADGTDVAWYNISNNTELTMDDNGLYEIGASALDAHKTGTYYQELSFNYTFDGTKYINDYTITGIKLTLHIHQKDYLQDASDYGNYSQFDEDGDGYINGYAISSLYAAHYITGNVL